MPELNSLSSGGIAAFYTDNGYFVLPEALMMAEVEVLRAETARICTGEAGDVRGVAPRRESDDWKAKFSPR